eukprot:776431_1
MCPIPSPHITNTLWSLHTAMIILEGYIQLYCSAQFPLELLYLSAQFYGFKTQIILFSTLYTHPDMPNGLQFLKPQGTHRLNGAHFNIHAFLTQNKCQCSNIPTNLSNTLYTFLE